jgi:hypothetical protein
MKVLGKNRPAYGGSNFGLSFISSRLFLFFAVFLTEIFVIRTSLDVIQCLGIHPEELTPKCFLLENIDHAFQQIAVANDIEDQ